jgi:hypothetical protein
MNKLSKVSESGISIFFTVEKTQLFKLDMDLALKTMELMEVMKVLIKYEILKCKESLEFLEGFNEMNKGWQKEFERSILVDVVQTRESRCMACEFGNDMTAYEFHYKHSEAPEPYNRVIYMKEFGMLYDIKDGILHDIRICNSFLTKDEMKELE